MLSCHLLLGRPLDLFSLIGCHSVAQHLVHLLSFILVTCPAHLHFCFSVYSLMSTIFVLFLISEHGILFCSFRPNISLSIALSAVLSLSIVCWETMFGSHRSLLARHSGPLLVFWMKWGVVYLGIGAFPCFFQNSSMLLWSWHRFLHVWATHYFHNTFISRAMQLKNMIGCQNC